MKPTSLKSGVLWRWNVPLAFVLALMVLVEQGCAAALPAMTMGMQATQLVGVGAGIATGEGTAEDSEEMGARCDQVQQEPPPIFEVRTSPQLGLTMRHWVLSVTSSAPKWAPDPQARWDLPKWYTQSVFQPPLEGALGSKGRFMIYTPAVPKTEAETAAELGFAAFPPEVGSFTYGGRRYRYTIAKKLPCFKTVKTPS